MIDKLKQSQSITDLFECILKLENLEECFKFFDDLCTVHELESLAQRLEVAKLLQQGETYTSIANKTGASTATISRVNRVNNYGNDIYETVFKRVKKEK